MLSFTDAHTNPVWDGPMNPSNARRIGAKGWFRAACGHLPFRALFWPLSGKLLDANYRLPKKSSGLPLEGTPSVIAPDRMSYVSSRSVPISFLFPETELSPGLMSLRRKLNS